MDPATDPRSGLSHSLGIVHRDLRVENLLFTKDGSTIIICDLVSHWGIRRAPEIDRGIHLDAGWTKKSDIYDLGSCIQALIYGNAPLLPTVEWPVPVPKCTPMAVPRPHKVGRYGQINLTTTAPFSQTTEHNWNMGMVPYCSALQLQYYCSVIYSVVPMELCTKVATATYGTVKHIPVAVLATPNLYCISPSFFLLNGHGSQSSEVEHQWNPAASPK